ncbi:hypothetical protein FAES_1656 [Fibrella aestuarina BUZ 2]|uniref:Uncharacterized protein n=1 Tax=Fibrella aestuarina BUZ 2 TaxID=1166018 RepID=I0K6B3_9BACT|nr:hypothetical protein [Fibrella aestuarina]CCG99666.1 hypothetical protein FAES_1656 [Fibrella aestuarina BUZ 2]
MNTFALSLAAMGLSVGVWLLVRLGYTYLPPSWDDKPFQVGLLLYLVALLVTGWAIVRAVGFLAQQIPNWGRGLLAVALSLVAGLVALAAFMLIYGEGMQGYSDR